MADKQEIKFKAGEKIFEESMGSDGLYIIKEGQIQIYRNGKNGQKIPLAIVNSGSYLGEMALLAGRPHSSTAIALTDVTAIKIPKESIESQLEQVPSWLIALTKGLVTRLSAMNDLLKRNNIVDEKIMGAISAAEDHIK